MNAALHQAMDSGHGYLIVRVRLLTKEEGGRTTMGPVKAGLNGYRPQLWFGLLIEGRKQIFDDAVWIAMDREQLMPGEEALVTLEPLRPALVDVLERGMLVEFYEGARKVGEGVIEQSIRPNQNVLP